MSFKKTLMVQGTSSDAGKSVLVAALCRAFMRQGMQVAPFKPQNMALNSAVTADGGEIGRAQAVQALAANVEPEVDFNPVLLKPSSDTGCQVIIHGKAVTNLEAQAYHHYKKVALNAVLVSHQRLLTRFDRIVVEGAGSPAEINLREGDIANMGFADHSQVDCPVILVADIDRGGVFAQIVGTLDLLSESERQRTVGFIINKFRGDISLLQSGLDWLENKTGKPVLGVLPYLHGLEVAAEDAIETQQVNKQAETFCVVVPVLPRISNHTDFDPLRLHPQIDLIFAKPGQPLPAADLIMLPGSKNVIADLAFLREQGWHTDIARHLRFGGKVWGICGGYQMLGETITDPAMIEGQTQHSQGLGYLPVQTELKPQKTLVNREGYLCLNGQTVAVSGYEIHAGISTTIGEQPFQFVQQLDGVVCQDNQVAGGYLHGVFDQPAALQLLIKWAGFQIEAGPDQQTQQINELDRLTDACQQYLDLPKLEQIINDWEPIHG